MACKLSLFNFCLTEGYLCYKTIFALLQLLMYHEYIFSCEEKNVLFSRYLDFYVLMNPRTSKSVTSS